MIFVFLLQHGLFGAGHLQGGECGVVRGMEAEPSRTSMLPPHPGAVGAHSHFMKYSPGSGSLRYKTCGPYIVTKGFIPI